VTLVNLLWPLFETGRAWQMVHDLCTVERGEDNVGKALFDLFVCTAAVPKHVAHVALMACVGQGLGPE
jgi:hypothetical protein